MADDITSRSLIAQGFERKIAASKWALLFEQLWPRLWIILGVVALFVLVSLAGVWPMLGDTGHRIAIAAFAIALLAAVVFAVRVRLPSRDEAIRRIERVSNEPHRPASSWEDTLSGGGNDETTQAIWQAHRKRMSDMLARLRVGKPSPRADRYDPFALRALLFLGVVLLLGLVGDSASDRLRSAFRFGGAAALANARLDAWITPPAYTSRPPVLLADGARGNEVQPADAEPKPLDVPDKSTLIVRLSGAPGAQLGLERLVSGGKPERYVNERPKTSDVSELRFVLQKTGQYRLFADGAEVGTWPINVIPDEPPKIALSKDPERTPRGSMKLTYKASDDYGIVSAAAKFRRIPPKASDPAKSWAKPAALKGPRLPLERPPQLALRLPTAKSKDGEANSYLELGQHAWAGLPVAMTLEALDAAGQTGRSPTLEMILPERQFRKPLARAVIEQRRKLMSDNRNRDQVLLALDALTIEPHGFIDDTSAYLGLRMAFSGLQRAKRRAEYAAVNDQLWYAALRIEDGSLSDAERALRDAQDKLSQALEKGASDQELQKLMQEMRQALNDYMDQLAKQNDDQNKDYAQGTDEQNQTVNQQDLDRMMRNLEEMARNGSREQAQQLLSEMRDLMERLQAGRMNEEQQKNAQVMMRKLEELGDVANQQQQLMDETFGEQRKQGQQKTQPGRGGRSQQKGAQQQGQRGQPSPGQKGERGQGQERGEQGEGQDGQDGMQGQSGQGQLSQRQRQLRERLSQLQKELQDKGMGKSEQLEGAGEAMEKAEQALQEGNFEEATGQQSRALENMRQGAQQMAQDMMRQMPGRQGQAGDAPRDPMGRPQRAQGPDLGTSVKVPDEIDMQRARQILEELRRRVGEQTRPPVELDYLERLLRRF